MNDNETSFGPDVLERLSECESCLDYEFVDKKLLYSALTHASGADHRLLSNERLEFLGDAILGSIICEELFRSHPTALEGELTRIKSVVVSRQTCAKVSVRLDLAHLLILGKGMASSPGIPASVLSDVFEALVAAIYLDGGIEPTRTFVLRYMTPEIEATTDAGHGENYKSQLQQVAQRNFGSTPVYRLVDEKGPDHNKTFQVSAKIGDRIFEPAWGNNKKEAEQKAANHALAALDGKPVKSESEESSAEEASAEEASAEESSAEEESAEETSTEHKDESR